MEKQTHDEVEKFLTKADAIFKKHADTINTLNKNQQILVKEIEEIKKNNEVNKRVEEIIKKTQEDTKKVEEAAKPVEPAPTTPTVEEKKEE